MPEELRHANERVVGFISIGFILGFLIGLTGVGGGALLAPALYAVLGLSYQAAVSVTLIYASITKAFSAVQHVRQGTVLWRLTLLYGVLGIPGAILGARIVHWTDDSIQQVFPFVMSGLLLLVASLIIWESGESSASGRRKPFSPFNIKTRGVLAVAVVQSFAGVLLGATSVGAGSIVILSMLYLFRMPAQQVVGSNIVIAIIIGIPAWLTHFAVVGVDWNLLGLLVVGSAAGSVLGAKCTMLIPERPLKRVVAGIIYLGAIATLVKAWTT
ncbi:MAG: sulfite exporter TauE/SafE family protein [Acidobacteriota bacterium]|nr:sulfite exporter TauE/SafE family protein [Acidobacteriota bacterium]